MSKAPLPAIGDRALFPTLQARAYLNHAAISPPNLLVIRAVNELMQDYAARGVSAFLDWMQKRELLRADLAQLLGTQASQVAMTTGTTNGLINLAMCVDWEPGDRVLVFQGEFPANITPWQRAAETFDLKLEMLPLDGFGDGSGRGLQRLEEALSGGARMVAVSAVQFSTGLRMPLRAMSELAHAAGAELFVDAIQACGATPLHMQQEGIDYLVSGAHKWMMGLTGCGFAGVSQQAGERLVPRVAGWLSHDDGLGFLFNGPGQLRYDRAIRKGVSFLEGGAPQEALFAGLAASTTLLLGLGVQDIFEHLQRYHDQLDAGLLDRGFTSLRASDPAARSGTLSALPPAGHDVVTLQASLSEQGISTTIPDGRLRFSPHWPNALTEVPMVLDAIDHALRA